MAFLFKEKRRISEDMNHLTKDGDLPWGWVAKYEAFTKNAQDEYMRFYTDYCNNRYGDPKRKYASLKSLLLYIDDAKKKYARMGECFLFWFVETWAKNDEVNKLESELKYIEENFSALESKYKQEQYIENVLLPSIKRKALDIVKKNKSIIQTDVYKYFREEEKIYVRDVLRMLSIEGKIKREKCGRTYKLTT